MLSRELNILAVTAGISLLKFVIRAYDGFRRDCRKRKSSKQKSGSFLLIPSFQEIWLIEMLDTMFLEDSTRSLVILGI